MNTSSDHLINSRVLTTFNPINLEIALDKQKNYLFDLSYLSILNIDGDKSNEFLQGQLTCDLRLVTDIHMIQGAQCNLKGRILCLLDIFNWDGIKLVVPKDLIESTHNSLSKTALLSRVSIKENNQLKVFGFCLQNPNDLLPGTTFFPDNLYAQSRATDFCYYHLGNGFYMFIVHGDKAEQFIFPFAQQEQLLGSLTWHTLNLYNKYVDIYPESRGAFLPHRLDLHQTQYLSFDKGCYKGQEIIARTQYRATLKHEMNLYTVDSVQNLYSGQKIFKANEEIELGELVDYSLLNTNKYLVAASMLKGTELQVRFEGQGKASLLRPV